ncbi:MAG: cation:proton antiporter [Candidatus Omnitrophica bacterium]|nr:cation:proton antiporter [Candidatus Omnitrophota bacterium]MCB9747122.1 cation:proton antiporter [Candidatus Omnitrophota bacterium]
MDLEILLLIGSSMFLGTLFSKIFSRFNIPQVISYVFIGLIMGNSFLQLWSAEKIEAFTPFVNLALGIIGFMIGAELKMEIFKNRGRSIYSILFCEVFVTFAVVSFFIILITKKVYLGVLFGALASATAPAATVDVLWENKARGPLTTTILAIVALDDVLALLLYGFASVFAKTMITQEHVSFLHALEMPLIEIGSSIGLGVAGAYLLYWVMQIIKDRERILPFSLGILCLIVGLATQWKIDLILSSMIMGFILTNLSPSESKGVFEAIKRFSTPIYVLFFVLVGARLDVRLMFASGISVIAFVYVLSRSFGKMSGSILGGFIGGAHESVTKYLGLCLFSQAGVAIGMAISIHQNLSHMGAEASQIGLLIINVIVGTTFIVQLIGPICVRFAIFKAKEAGRDVNEDDVIDSLKVSDVLDEDIPLIKESVHLDEMVDLVKKSESAEFCVLNEKGSLLGIISIGDLREVLREQELELDTLILAKDIAVPPSRVILGQKMLRSAIEIFQRTGIEYLPVVKDEETKEFVGMVHYKVIMEKVQKEVITRRGTS